jgi:hypothetical protein
MGSVIFPMSMLVSIEEFNSAALFSSKQSILQLLYLQRKERFRVYNGALSSGRLLYGHVDHMHLRLHVLPLPIHRALSMHAPHENNICSPPRIVHEAFRRFWSRSYLCAQHLKPDTFK